MKKINLLHISIVLEGEIHKYLENQVVKCKVLHSSKYDILINKKVFLRIILISVTHIRVQGSKFKSVNIIFYLKTGIKCTNCEKKIVKTMERLSTFFLKVMLSVSVTTTIWQKQNTPPCS